MGLLMSNQLDNLLKLGTQPGIYIINSVSVDPLKKILGAYKYLYFYLNSLGIANSELFLEKITPVFKLPYIPTGYDSLLDRLTDLEWLPDKQRGFVFLFENFSEFMLTDPNGFETALFVLKETSLRWSDNRHGNRLFYTLLKANKSADSIAVPTKYIQGVVGLSNN